MSFAPGTAPTASRRVVSWIVALGVIATSALVASPAAAADVDLVVNVTSDRGSYNAEETATYTVRVDNRGGGATSVPSTLTLTVPNTQNSPVAWENTITCAPENGAVCPTGFTRSGTTVAATIPFVPIAGVLTFTVAAPGYPDNRLRGPIGVVATLATSAGDVDIEPSTNSSNINVLISSADANYSTTATGQDSAAPGTTPTFDVVLKNDGSPDSVFTEVSLRGSVGSGTPSTRPFYGLRFTGVQCLNETGGALCANLRGIDGAGDLVVPQPNPLLSPGAADASLGVLDMPTGSSVTLRYAVDLGTPACNAAATGANRLLTLTGTIYSILGVGFEEESALAGDNTAIALTNVPVPPCAVGDLSTVSLVQPDPQSIGGVGLGGAFQYTAQFQNLAGAAATNAPIEFSASWPGGPGLTVSGSPVCVPSGGAACPTNWIADGAQVRGTGASFPFGGSLSITFSGTGGTDDLTVCRPRSMVAAARVVPPGDFADTNWNPSQSYAEGQGNNARVLSTTTAVGSPCTDSHNDAVQMDGVFTDPAATIPLVGPMAPGQVVYLKSTFTSQMPSPDFTTWRMFQSFGIARTGVLFDTTGPNRWFRHQAGDPAGITLRDDYYLGNELVAPFDTGVRCVALGGAVCPIELDGPSGVGGAGDFWLTSWASYFKPGTMPVMPEGSSFSVISTFKVPDLNARYAVAGCVPTGVAFGSGAGSNTRTSLDIPIQTTISALTDPATRDRDASNDSTTVNVPLAIKRCDNTLAVTKTTSTATMPLDRKVKYTIVATNTSSNALDLPRILDTLSVNAPATIACVSTTLNAVCPTVTPLQNVRYFAGGSTGPITFQSNPSLPVASFDFVWGSPGTPTMPPGSTVTFEVTVNYPMLFTGNVNNTVIFAAADTAGAGAWPQVTQTASVTSPAGSRLSLAKKVTPVTPRPGAVVTFSVDVINSGATLPTARFTDEVNALLAPSNPSGYANLTCRPLTEADNVLRTGFAVGSVACPSFVSDADGINGVITDFQSNSGLRITYTAVAPLTAGSLPNIATLTQNDTQVNTGDASSQANFLVMTAKVSGTVWDDANGSAAGTFSNIDSAGENPTNAGGLNAVLIDAETGEVIAVVPVNADGTYEFVSAPVLTNVSVAITTGNPDVGTTFTTPTLPAGWIATSPLTQEVFNTGVVETIEKDFGIEQPPTTDDKTDPIVPNPGGNVQVQVPSLTGADPEDGSLGTGQTFQIVTLPTSGTLYYDGVAVTTGQIITDYDPTKLTVDPNPGAVTVVFTVVAIDAAGVPDPTPATVTMPFSVSDAASISGSVWFDANKDGVKDPGEVGIAGVTVTLRGVDDAGNTVELQTVTDNAGNWTFPNLAPGTYGVREEQPDGYDDGTDQLGTGAEGQGTAGNDGFTTIVLIGGQAAINYNFGEILEEVVVPPVDPPVDPPVVVPPVVVPPVVVPPVVDPPVVVPPVVVPPGTSEPATRTPGLANTGTNGLVGGLTVATLLAGLGLLLVARRRRIEGSHK